MRAVKLDFPIYSLPFWIFQLRNTRNRRTSVMGEVSRTIPQPNEATTLFNIIYRDYLSLWPFSRVFCSRYVVYFTFTTNCPTVVRADNALVAFSLFYPPIGERSAAMGAHIIQSVDHSGRGISK
jgi:hypothetical protein